MEKVKINTKTHHTEKDNFYPKLVIKNNENPNKLYAFPFVGLLIKAIMLFPASLFLMFVAIAFFALWLITPFVVLFTGKYWDPAYKMTLGFMIYRTKYSLFLLGLTDKYPGLDLETHGLFEITFKKPTAVGRWLAFPIAGFAIRLFLSIPYYIYSSVLDSGTYVAMVASWFGILNKGKYPESLYEFNRDSIRVSLAYTVYLTYLSDRYPSFWISMKHKTVKITLIIIGAILFILSNRSNNHRPHEMDRQMPAGQHAPTNFPFKPSDY